MAASSLAGRGERFAGLNQSHPQFQQFYDDLFYSDMTFSYNYKPVKALTPSNDRIVKHFHDVGWVAVHKNMANPPEHIQFMVKSSPYGSYSHSHADQNSFTLFAYGQPLLINGGYYAGGYGGKMHRYSRETHAHNALTFDGKGQLSDMSYEAEEKCRSVTGKIVLVTEESQFVAIKADASLAYRDFVPHLQKCIRDVYFVYDKKGPLRMLKKDRPLSLTTGVVFLR